MALLREAHAAGAELVVFPELALTTFFPRYWYDEIERDRRLVRARDAERRDAALFDLAAELKVGFYLGYAELAEEGGAAHRYNTSILVGPDGQIVGKYRKVHLPGTPIIAPASRSSIWRSATSRSAISAFRCGGRSARWSA